jgi:adenylate cyclase class IV
MIEVERRYLMNPKQESILLKDAEFIDAKTNEDIFFDMSDYALARQDNWLRTRNGAFELKRRLHNLGHKLGGTAYDEISDEQKIRDFLKLAGSNSLEADLLEAGYLPFARIIKQRRGYKRGSFHIDLDVCDFGYEIAEIELMVERDEERGPALERINKFATDIGLDQTPVRGKIIEYLYRYSRPHYDTLVEAGVI